MSLEFGDGMGVIASGISSLREFEAKNLEPGWVFKCLVCSRGVGLLTASKELRLGRRASDYIVEHGFRVGRRLYSVF